MNIITKEMVCRGIDNSRITFFGNKTSRTYCEIGKCVFLLRGHGNNQLAAVERFRRLLMADAADEILLELEHMQKTFCRMYQYLYDYLNAKGTEEKVTTETREILIKMHDDELPLPEMQEYGDWVDLRAAETVEMKKGDYRVIPLGVSMKLPDGYEAHVAPRSSTFKNYGIQMVNSIGIIDNSYCGDNDIWGFCALAMRDTVIQKGDRICQFRIVEKQPHLKFIKTDHLDGADRGGFGSTGTR